MKYLSTVTLILALAVTWKAATAVPLVPVSIHNDLQLDIARIIETAIVQQVPNADNLKFQRLYSETLSPTSVRANFSYSFEIPDSGNSTTSLVEGSALVERDPANADNWILKKVDVGTSSLVFNEGIVITPTGEHPEAGTPEKEQK